MLGFIIGTVCLIGLVRALRRGAWRDGCHGYGRGFGGPRGFGARRLMLRSILERLDTTPGQEKVVVAAIEELQGNRRVLRDEARQTRADFARAIASGMIDDTTLEETFARHDRLLAQLRVSFVEAMRKITEALDERQRKHVADLLESRAFGSSRWGNPYRGASDEANMWA